MAKSSNTAMRPLFGLFLILLAMSLVVGGRKLFEGKERIPWRTSYAAARDEARATNKPMLVYFTATWCGPCQELKHTTWADADVDKALQAYVPVKLDIDLPENRVLATRFKVDGIPRYLVLRQDDDEGRPVKDQVGYMDAEQFLGWLK